MTTMACVRMLLLGALAPLALAAADKPGKPDPTAAHYAVEAIPGPTGVDAQVGGLCRMADGRLAACFHRGEVAILNPATRAWTVFAEGLHEPLGILAEPDGSLLVMQRPELTRLKDTDGDGKADLYQTVWGGFGMTGNYHEFAFGPARGPDGRVYVSLNVASNGAGVFPEMRGTWSDIGVELSRVLGEWGKAKGEIGRMYSRVPYRGWVFAVDPATGKAEPFASGFRSPDGIGFDAAGNLLVDDNQGDWRGSSELFVVKRGGFYGHPASLVWRPDWDGRVPLKVPVADLEKLRTPAAVWFPHGSFASSPTQPVVIPSSPAWGPYAGQTLVGEMNVPRILRVLLEEVDGQWQGATLPFIETPRLKGGLHRFAFLGDTLWVGRTHLSWAGGEGLATVTPTGPAPMDVESIRIRPTGFLFRFTRPLDPVAADHALWSVRRYTYAYHATYGSPQLDAADAPVARVSLSKDRREAELEIPDLKAHRVYEFGLAKLAAADGAVMPHPKLAYTVRRVPAR